MAPRYFEKRSSFKQHLSGKSGERVSEYFADDKGERYVRRFELLALLTHLEKARRQNTAISRFWRWLTAPFGSGGVYAVEPPTQSTQETIS